MNFKTSLNSNALICIQKIYKKLGSNTIWECIIKSMVIVTI